MRALVGPSLSAELLPKEHVFLEVFVEVTDFFDFELAFAKWTLVVLSGPHLDALVMEVVPHVTGQRNQITLFAIEITQAD